MMETKRPWDSKRVWGCVGALVFALVMFGAELFQVHSIKVASAAFDVAIAAFALLGLYGGLVAEKKITLWGP